MKRKILVTILTFALAFCALGLVACGGKDTEHTHAYETTYSHDATHHWYACEKDGCTEVSEKAEHTFVNYVCSVCQYDRTTPPPASSQYQVTETQFNSAITALSNVTMDIELEDSDGLVITGKYYIDGNKLKIDASDTYSNDNIIAIYEVTGSSVDVYIYTGENTGWAKYGSDSMYVAYLESVLYVGEMLNETSFADFEYSNEYYTYTDTFYEGTDYETTMTFTMQFNNGVLLSTRIDYDENGVESYDYYVFSNFGSTTVNVPAEYTDYSGGASGFASYFVFDNVTVERTGTQTITYDTDPTNPEVIESEETFKVNGDKWLYVNHDSIKYQTSSPPQVYYYDKVVYFDGESTYVSDFDYDLWEYVENQPDESEKSLGEYFLYYAKMLALGEDDLVQEPEGVYTAESMSIYGVYDFTDVSITIVDGKISAIEFILVDETEGCTMTQEYSYTFSNWGTTTIDN